MMSDMANTLMERVRLSPEDARLLRRLARERKSTKSAVIREGLHRLAEVEDRLRRREKAFARLIELADEVPGTDIRWSLRP